MAYLSPATKEITAKIVYYGPGMCGKTTNLQKVHQLMRPQMKSELLSVATETDRTIYFDFLPVKLGKIAGFDFNVRVFTVPGQPYYAETRRIVLQGADGVVFVADSQRFMLDQNRDSMLDLKKNLRLNGLDYNTIPLVLQFNKQDLPDLTPVSDLDAALNDRRAKTFIASAHTGQNVVETLKYITLTVFKHVRDSGSGARTARNRGRAQAEPEPEQVEQTLPINVPGGAQALEPPVVTGELAMPPPPPPPDSYPSMPPVRPTVQREISMPGIPMSRPASAASTPLEDLVGQVAQGAIHSDAPMPSTGEILGSEFQNLARLHHNLVERVASLESELQKIKNDHRDMKRLLGRKLRI